MPINIDIEGIGSVLIERSRRTKHINIYVTPLKGVRVAVPYGVSYCEAEKAVRSRKAWVKRHLSRMEKFKEEYKFIPNDLFASDVAEAGKRLKCRVRELADKHGFDVNRVTIRNQRTRWGSCSAKNNINLNVKLAQLPEELFDYVIWHELMHTKIKNHQKEFWKALDRFVGNAKALDAKLRKYHLEMI
jgi:predicted metal-dependent hydrolase